MAELDVAALTALYADNSSGDISAADLRSGHAAWHHDTDTGQVADGDYFVCAMHGDDTNTGTHEAPFLTIGKAATSVGAGDKVYVRGGRYNEEVDLNTSGSAGSRIYLLNYPGETPIVDGTGLGTTSLFRIDGNFYTIEGFLIENLVDDLSGNASMRIGGTNAIIRRCIIQRGGGAGFALVGTPIHIEDCISQYNYDSATSGEDADGFVAGTGTVDHTLVRCLSYRNSDDGFDFYQTVSGATFIDCVALENGYLEDGTHPANGDGHGYKQGVSSVGGGHKYINCKSTGNYGYGFEAGASTVASDYIGCVAVDNGSENFRMDGSAVNHSLYNCVSINPGSADGFNNDTIQHRCSWTHTKTTTGNPSITLEGYTYINTFDRVVRMYADGDWRTMASGW